VSAQPVAGTLTLEVPRRGAQPARVTTLTARFGRVSLHPPRYCQAEHLPTVEVFAVQVMEEHLPIGIEPIEWLLLSTWAITTALRPSSGCRPYAARWGIEILHKVLKSGCRIEARQLESADRLHRCLAVYRVIAWCILYATMLSRTVPDMPCTALLEPEEWQALYYAQCTPTLPPTPPRLRQAVHWIAHLGDFLDRRGDGEPGVTVLWKGFQHLTDLTTMYRIMRPTPP
jgi:hypothetical protein